MKTTQISSDAQNWGLIMQQFRNGDRKAFETIFKYNYSLLVYYGFKITKDQSISEEIVSDSFMKAYSRSSDFPSIATLKSFLFTTIRNACFDHLDKEKTRAKYFTQLDLSSEDIEMEEINTLEFERLEAELIILIKEEVDKLPRQAKKVFTMRYFERLSPHKVAELNSISYQTVLNQTSIAVSRLRCSSAIVKKLKGN